jgi:23S rRNA G2069 N7-methylase RlmK/C1962 C5-methylase RlmI
MLEQEFPDITECALAAQQRHCAIIEKNILPSDHDLDDEAEQLWLCGLPQSYFLQVA